jgi:hypothetical protein
MKEGRSVSSLFKALYAFVPNRLGPQFTGKDTEAPSSKEMAWDSVGTVGVE